MDKIYVLWVYNGFNERLYISDINMRCKEEKHLQLTPFKDKARRFTYDTANNIAIMNWWKENGDMHIEDL